VAQTFAIKQPSMVSALVLISTACQLVSVSTERLRARNEMIKQSGMAVAADPQLSVISPANSGQPILMLSPGTSPITWPTMPKTTWPLWKTTAGSTSAGR
jgi:hypothetical protein